MIRQKRRHEQAQEPLEQPSTRTRQLALDQFDPGEYKSIEELMDGPFGEEFAESTLGGALAELQREDWLLRLPPGNGRKCLYRLTDRAVEQLGDGSDG